MLTHVESYQTSYIGPQLNSFDQEFYDNHQLSSDPPSPIIGAVASSGNQKVVCDCKACSTLGKTRKVSKSTRSRHRRRFQFAPGSDNLIIDALSGRRINPRIMESILAAETSEETTDAPVLVNSNLDQHLNPGPETPYVSNVSVLEPHVSSSSIQNRTTVISVDKKIMVHSEADAVEKITVTLFHDILSVLWSEFCV